jgi:hypothetical protein
MSTTVTIRIDHELRRALEERARHQGKSLSTLVRETLEATVAARSLESRVAHLRGRIRLTSSGSDGWRSRLRERNWRK